MKKYLLASAAAVAMLPSVAFAQDWWSGPEIGLQAGYGWGSAGSNLHCPDGGEGFAQTSIISLGSSCATNSDFFNDPVFKYRINPNGFVGGGHAGYDFQWGSTVLGIEGDVEGADVSGSVSSLNAGFGVKSSMNFDASVRARLGWAFSNVMVYGTGGAAFGDVKTSYKMAEFTGGPLQSIGSTDGVRLGWTAGAGIEYAFTRNWDVGLEYRYTDLGSNTFRAVVPAGQVYDSNDFNFNAIRLSVTYRFAPPPPAPMAPMPAAAPAPAPMVPNRTFLVFFDFDKYNLTPDARRVIEAAAASYKATGTARIDVSGYTDLAGTQAYNLRLSQRRADAVAGYLARQGVPKAAMDVKWFGKEHPRVPTPDGVREPQNRRVEIVMQ